MRHLLGKPQGTRQAMRMATIMPETLLVVPCGMSMRRSSMCVMQVAGMGMYSPDTSVSGLK